MVLGLFEGELELQIPSRPYSAGEKIRGSVVLHLPSPLRARDLKISFYGELAPGHGHKTAARRIFDSTLTLSGEKIFQDKESFPFEIPIPASLLVPSMDSLMGLPHFVPPRVRGWYLHASLDLPRKLDIHKRAKIDISALSAPSGLRLPTVGDLKRELSFGLLKP